MCFHRWSSTSGSRPQGYLSVYMTFCQAVLCRVMVYCCLPAGIAMTICAQCAQMASWLTQFIWSWRLFSVLDTTHGACWANGCLYGFFPKNQQSFDIPKLFDAQKVTKYRKDKGFKCSASEMLTLYKLLQYFLEAMYMSNSCMVKECRSFIAWCQLLDYLQSIPYLDSPCPKTLLGLVESALECHTLAGFANYTKPKHHWTLHFFDCLKRWGQLPSCWSCERKHKTARKYGPAHCNLQTYDKGLLVACTMEHLHNLHNAELLMTLVICRALEVFPNLCSRS